MTELTQPQHKPVLPSTTLRPNSNTPRPPSTTLRLYNQPPNSRCCLRNLLGLVCSISTAGQSQCVVLSARGTSLRSPHKYSTGYRASVTLPQRSSCTARLSLLYQHCTSFLEHLSLQCPICSARALSLVSGYVCEHCEHVFFWFDTRHS